MVKRFLAAALTVLVGSAMAVSVGCDGGADTKSDKKVQGMDNTKERAVPAADDKAKKGQPGGGVRAE